VNAPQHSIALLRVVVGAWFLKAVWTKLALAHVAGLPYPGVAERFLGFYPRRVAEFAAGNPVGWYRHFLEQTVLPHAALFATLQSYGEVVVGIALVLGLLTRVAAGIGLFLTLNYALATQWMSFGQQGFHVMLVTAMVIFMLSGAGRTWGADHWLHGLHTPARWLRILA